MSRPNKPNALLLVSRHCPHCHALEALLRERLNNGGLGALEVADIEQSPEVQEQYVVRSVPWLRLGPFIFDEALTPAGLDAWIERAKGGSGQSRYIAYLLERGKLVKAIEWIESGNATLRAVVPILASPDEKMNIRVGVGAILEHFEGTQAIRDLIPDLVALLQDESQVTRTDACHYLSLTHSREAVGPLNKMLDDEVQQVREVARESIALLNRYK